MLLEFTVGNYRSFKDEATLSLVATALKAQDPRLDAQNRLEVLPNLHVLRSAAVYGANASGKSNLGRAIWTMKRVVMHSARDSLAGEPLPAEPFLLNDLSTDGPSYFEVVFVVEGRRYRYGFEIDREQVCQEWLYHVPGKREAKLFSREGQDFKLRPDFKAEGQDLAKRTRANALFLPVCAQFNGQISSRLVAWFQNLRVVSGADAATLRHLTEELLAQGEREGAQVRELLSAFNLGFTGLRLESRDLSDRDKHIVRAIKQALSAEADAQLPLPEDVKAVLTRHPRYSATGQETGHVDLELDHHESAGTTKLFALAGMLVDALGKGRTVVFDEFDARLHPQLARKLVELFHRPETNTGGAQLLLMTHDTTLLRRDLFRRDQIWFVEKNRYGASDLYSLAQFKRRSDASFDMDYAKGLYGAMPLLGRLDGLDLRNSDEADA